MRISLIGANNAQLRAFGADRTDSLPFDFARDLRHVPSDGGGSSMACMTTENITTTAPAERLADPEALTLLKKQLAALNEIAERHYQEVAEEAKDWMWLTEAIVAKAFGKESSQYEKIAGTRAALQRMQQHYDGGPEHEQLQLAYEDRCRKRKAILKNLIQELEVRIHLAE